MKLFEFLYKKFFVLTALYFFSLLILVRFIYNANLLPVPLGILEMLEIATAISVFLLFYEKKAGVYVRHLRFVLSIILLLSTVSFFPLYGKINPFLETEFTWSLANGITVFIINLIYNGIATLLVLVQVGRWERFETLRSTFISIAMLIEIVLCFLVFIYTVSWAPYKPIPPHVIVYVATFIYAVYWFLKAKKQEIDYRALVIISYWMGMLGGVIAPILTAVMWEISTLIWDSLVGVPLVVSLLSLKF